MSSREHKDLIWHLIKGIKTGMLVTNLDDDMRSRPMQLVQDEYDGKIWFFTDKISETAFEIDSDKHVNLNFSCPKSETYVSLSGKARITTDKDLIDKFWNSFIAAWYPDGKDGGNVALIEIKIHAGEHWDNKSSKVIQLFNMAKTSMTDEAHDIGRNEKFGSLQ